jgi:hypothetical protein
MAKVATERQWHHTLAGQASVILAAPRADVSYVGADQQEHRAIQPNDTHDGASSDVEGRGRRTTVAHLQRECAKLQDCTRLRSLEATLRQQGNWAQLGRLKELRHPEVSRKWLWHLNPREGAVLTEADYVVNIQKRLGAWILPGAVPCRLCGEPLDPQLEHSEVCALAEATKGHYACVRALVGGFRLADSAVTTEPRGLTDTQARPADIFTAAAVPGRSAALDACIASP